MVAIARTWSLVTSALVHRITSVTPATLRTAPTTTHVVTVVLVMALGCAAVLLATQVLSASQLLNQFHILTAFVKFTR